MDVTFSVLSLPLAPRSLFFSSLLSFTAEDKLLLGPCGPLPHLSAPLSSSPASLSPLLSVFPPLSPPVGTIVARTILLSSDYFMSVTRVHAPFFDSLFPSPCVCHSPLSLSPAGYKTQRQELRDDIQQSTTGGQNCSNKEDLQGFQLPHVTGGH